MTNGLFTTEISALLYMQRALFGMITPSLRAVSVDLDREKEIYICYFFYDGPITEELLDLASCAVTEASDSWFSERHYERLDVPTPIPTHGRLAYLRKEPGISPPKVQLLPRPSIVIANAYLVYAMQQALLGRVIPTLRKVRVRADEQQHKLYFFFYYDEDITEELLKVSKEAIEIAKEAFPESFTVTEEITFFPYPKRLPDSGDMWSAFRRYEHL